MKKILLIILLSILFIFPLAYTAFAVEASLGVSTWYCWWKFNDNSDMDLDPALLFGPVLSLRFSESWSLSGVFLYGKFDSRNDNQPDITRYDSDLSLNYNINRYFKIFAGGKYMAFTWKDGGGGEHWSAGPGLGIGSTFPLTESLYLLLNLSGTYSFGTHDSHTDDGRKKALDMTETSFNSNMAFAYYISPASASVNLGFRYQLVRSDFKDNTNEKDGSSSFFGPTLSLVYSF